MTRLLTFNIRTSAAVKDLQNHWRFRRSAVLDAIGRANADIIGLQETRRRPLEFVSEYLDAYQRVAAGRNDGKEKGEACPIFIGSELRLDSHEFRWLSDTPSVAGSRFEGVALPRICSIARVTDLKTNAKVAFVNTHLDTQFRHIREQSVGLIKAWADADSVPWIIFGDFNCRIDSPELASLFENGWKDAMDSLAVEGEGSATFSSFKGNTDGARIDHIFVPNAVKVTGVTVDNQPPGRVPSDHWPVYVDLDLSALA